MLTLRTFCLLFKLFCPFQFLHNLIFLLFILYILVCRIKFYIYIIRRRSHCQWIRWGRRRTQEYEGKYHEEIKRKKPRLIWGLQSNLQPKIRVLIINLKPHFDPAKGWTRIWICIDLQCWIRVRIRIDFKCWTLIGIDLKCRIRIQIRDAYFRKWCIIWNELHRLGWVSRNRMFAHNRIFYMAENVLQAWKCVAPFIISCRH